MDYEIAYIKRMDFSDWARNETVGITESEKKIIRDFLTSHCDK